MHVFATLHSTGKECCIMHVFAALRLIAQLALFIVMPLCIQTARNAANRRPQRQMLPAGAGLGSCLNQIA